MFSEVPEVMVSDKLEIELTPEKLDSAVVWFGASTMTASNDYIRRIGKDIGYWYCSM